MRLTREQLALFEHDARERFVRAALAEVMAVDPKPEGASAARRAFVEEAISRATALGLAREVAVLRFISIATAHGLARASTPRALALAENDPLWSRPELARALAGVDPEGSHR